MFRTKPVTAPSKEIVVAKPEWGTKHTCSSCGARFYDLLRSPVTCSVCGVMVEPKTILKPRNPTSSRAAVAPRAVAELASDPDAIEEVVVEGIDGGDDDESGLLEDASDLAEEEDDPANYADVELEAEF